MEAQVKDHGRDWPQVLAILVACIPGLTSALLYSWTSPFILVLTSDKVNYNITQDEANLLPILAPVGIMASAIFFYKIHDLIGRKYTLLILSIPQATYWIITIVARDIYSLYIARIISGVADAIVYSAIPIYVGEVTTPRVRGTWGNGQSFSFNAGFFLINAIGSYMTIQQTAYICLTLPVLAAVLFLWMPESPYYCIMKGQEEKGRASLQWLLRKKDIEPDFQQLKADVERQISETGTWADLFRIKSNRRALVACLFMRFGQNLAGIAVVENYFQFIIQNSGSTALSPQASSIVFAGFLWVSMLGFSLTLDKFGRRKSFMVSSLCCAIVLLAEAVFFYIDEFQKNIDLSSLTWFPLVGFILYIFSYSGGIGILPSLMAGELFSTSIKGKALSICNLGLGFIVFVITFIFKSLTSLLGLYAPFLLFSICTFVSFALAYYIVPETKGKTLEEIQQDLKRKRQARVKLYLDA